MLVDNVAAEVHVVNKKGDGGADGERGEHLDGVLPQQRRDRKVAHRHGGNEDGNSEIGRRGVGAGG